jgi:type III secretion system chaperone SycN
MIAKIVNEFGNKMGFKKVEFEKNRILKLKLESFGDLYLEQHDPYLVIYIMREHNPVSFSKLTKALFFTHFKERKPFPVSSGLYRDFGVVFLIKLHYEDVVLENINKAVEYLFGLHERLSSL